MNSKPPMDSGDNIDVKDTWSFAGPTPAHFDEHINKSVPYYRDSHDLVCALSKFFVTHNSTVLDIGSSTGVLTRRLAQTLDLRKPRIIGLEVEADMHKEALIRENSPLIEYVNEDFLQYDLPVESCSLVTSFYTAQFVSPAFRQLFFDKIYTSLQWGGAALVFEKVRGSDARFQDIFNSLYIDYKLDKGYTPSNIITKMQSLRSVLEPFSTQGNLDLFTRSGFTDIQPVFRYLCFQGFLLIK